MTTESLNTKRILRLEGLALLAISLAAYAHFHFAWGIFALLFLVWDISLLGYLVNNKFGAWLYNIGHSTAPPLALLLVGLMMHVPTLLAVPLIWLAHIGLDRALGYGLKRATFADTHLGSIRAPRHTKRNGVVRIAPQQHFTKRSA